jgi:hypothetical protein
MPKTTEADRQAQLHLPIPPIFCTIPQAAEIISRGQSFIYAAITEGKIRAVKSDGRTLVIIKSLEAYAESLPPAQIKVFSRPPKRLRQKEREQQA